MFLGLPDYCYAKSPKTDEWVLILKGKSGYYTMDWGTATDEEVDKRNAALGVSKNQKVAMVAGATISWRAPAANPAFYDEQNFA